MTSVCFVAEKYAQVQQNPILPPATLFLRGQNAEKVSARSPNWRETVAAQFNGTRCPAGTVSRPATCCR